MAAGRADRFLFCPLRPSNDSKRAPMRSDHSSAPWCRGTIYGNVVGVPSPYLLVSPVQVRRSVPAGYHPCFEGHATRDNLQKPLARLDVRTGLYHLWSEETGTQRAGCVGWRRCRGDEQGPGEQLARPPLGEVVDAAGVPNEERCNPYLWPRYFRRRADGPIPPQWPESVIPPWYVWWRLYEIQTGRCASCLNPAACIDHDHRSGAVRGLLCLSCNRLEGRYFRRERLCIHEPPYCFDDYWRNPPAAPLGWVKIRSKYEHARWPLISPT